MIMPLGFIIGSPLIGFLADRLSLGRNRILLISLAASLACWSVFFLSGGKPDRSFILPLFFLMGLFGGGSLSLFMTILKEFFPPRLTGTAVGLMNPAAFLSAALFQPFTGYLMDAVGRTGSTYPREAYQQVFTVYILSMLLAFGLLLFLRNPKAGQASQSS